LKSAPSPDSEATESCPRTPLSSDSTNDGTITPNTVFDNTENESVKRKRRLSSLQHALPAPKRARTSVLQDNLLCEHCQQVDFQEVLDVDIFHLQRESDGILLADLGTRYNNMSTTTKCHLCHLIHRCRLRAKTLSGSYQLRMYSYLKSSKAIAFGLCKEQHRAKDIPCLGVVPSGMKGKRFRLQADATGRLFCLEYGRHDGLLFNPRILKPNANISKAEDWLNFCFSRHPLRQKRETQVTGLKLLDCQTYNVISAPANATYVALSYVWGTTTSHREDPSMEYSRVQNRDTKFTKTIYDATAAARALGYKYLWVDKLCIDQNNAEEKHNQISQMDSIYQSADVTIIAACGQDCHYGLPGINGTRRAFQRAVKIGQVSVFSSMLHPHHHVQSSKEVGRGWTLQEAALSTHRLVFTNDQLYFECNSTHCSESVEPNLNLIHNSNGKIYQCFQSGILSTNTGRRFAGLEPKYGFDMFRLYTSLIVQYTKRALTFEEDRPKAFAGIMAHFEKKGSHLVWGLAYHSDLRNVKEDYFVQGLLWAHQKHLSQAPSTKLRQDSTVDMTLRLPGSGSIPYWSWMAWRGEISFPLSCLMIRSQLQGVKLELGPNALADLTQYLSATMPSGPLFSGHITLPKALLLDADYVDLSEISIDESGNLRVHGLRIYCCISRGPLEPKALYEAFRLGKLEFYNLRNKPAHKKFVSNDSGETDRFCCADWIVYSATGSLGGHM